MKFLLLAYSHWIMSKKIGIVARRSSVKRQSYHNRVQLFEAQMVAIYGATTESQSQLMRIDLSPR